MKTSKELKISLVNIFRKKRMKFFTHVLNIVVAGHRLFRNYQVRNFERPILKLSIGYIFVYEPKH